MTRQGARWSAVRVVDAGAFGYQAPQSFQVEPTHVVDPAFPAAFPWFNTPRYWQDRILELREQIGAMQELPLQPSR